MRAASLLLIFAGVFFCQQQVERPAVELNGIVVDQETKEPLDGVVVQIIKYRERSEGPATGFIGASFQATTASDGTFKMQPVPGVYHASLRRNGYTESGPSGQAAEPLDIPERLAGSVSLSMWRLQPVAGVVLDADGKPAPDVDVRIIVVRPLGLSFSMPLRAEQTDTNGAFQFSDVPPGEYTLTASPRARMKKDEHGRITFPTYLGDVLNPGDATKIAIRPGQPPEPLRIYLQNGRPAVIRGLVTDQVGQSAAGSKVLLYRAASPTGPLATTSVDRDGRFELDHLTPGPYRIEAELHRDGVPLASEQAVTAASGPVEVNLRLSPPFSIEGRVEGDELPGELVASGVVRLRLVPAEGTFREERIVAIYGRTFRWDGVQAGRYLILPFGHLPGFYEESINVMNRDVLGEPVQLDAGYGPVTVFYREGPGGVRGTVNDQRGTVVVLVPVAEKLRNQQFIRIANVQAGGRFELTDVRPGEYFAWAFDRLERSRLEEVPFLASLLTNARRVNIEKRAVSELDLKLTTWPGY